MEYFPNNLGEYSRYITLYEHDAEVERNSTPLNDLDEMKIYIELAMTPVLMMASVSNTAVALIDEYVRLIKDSIVEIIDWTQIIDHFFTDEWAKEYIKFDSSLQFISERNSHYERQTEALANEFYRFKYINDQQEKCNPDDGEHHNLRGCTR